MDPIELILYSASAIVAGGTALLGAWYLHWRRRVQMRDALDELVRQDEESGLYDDVENGDG